MRTFELLKHITFMVFLLAVMVSACNLPEENTTAEGKVVSAPVISAADKDSSYMIKATISTGTDGAVIYYTMDGSEPSVSNGEIYTGSVDIYYDATLKAIAVKDGYGDSEIASEDYTFSAAGIGTPVDSYPNWQERTLLTHTNALRMAPAEYKSDYFGWDDTVEALSIYGPRNPLYWRYELNKAARFHSDDMNTNSVIQHDSSDGTAFDVRISSFYPEAQSVSENVGGTTSSIINILKLFMDDTSLSDPSSFNTDTGHRFNIMNTDSTIVGTGYANGYWTMDFAVNTPSGYPIIPAASHDFLETDKTTFMLNFYEPGSNPPLKVSLFLDGIKYDMPLDIGETWKGTYSVIREKASSCRSYYFLVVDSDGKIWRYPGSGTFLTYGEGSCTSNYQN